jgi:hypothetical protein
MLAGALYTDSCFLITLWYLMIIFVFDVAGQKEIIAAEAVGRAEKHIAKHDRRTS